MTVETFSPETSTQPSAESDAALLLALVQRRSGAFEMLVATYQDRLYGLAWRVTQSREDAEDAVQDGLVRAHRALCNEYSPARLRELRLRPWLYTVVLNSARNRVRSRRPAASLDQLRVADGPLIEPVAPQPGPASLAEYHDLAHALEAALAELPPRQRTAVVLRLVEGFTYEEAAGVIGRPIGTVKSDVHRGLRTLRQRLRDLLDDDLLPPRDRASRETGNGDGP